MAVTAPYTIAVVLYYAGPNNTGLAGGARTLPAIVISAGGAGGLVASLKAFAPEGDASFTGVQHSSTAAAGAHSWQWSAASGNSNS